MTFGLKFFEFFLTKSYQTCTCTSFHEFGNVLVNLDFISMLKVKYSSATFVVNEKIILDIAVLLEQWFPNFSCSRTTQNILVPCEAQNMDLNKDWLATYNLAEH